VKIQLMCHVLSVRICYINLLFLTAVMVSSKFGIKGCSVFVAFLIFSETDISWFCGKCIACLVCLR
jgi:hypothetical protein